MSPAAYYCWLSERRWLWFLRRRFQPRPDQNYPAAIALLMPFVVAGIALAAFAAVVALGNATTNTGDHPQPELTFVYLAIGAVTFAAGLVHWGFTWLVWNQRAARLRAAGSPEVAASRPGAIARWLLGPFYFLVVSVVTPVLLLTAVENVRGAMKWREVRTELLARGERLSIHEIAPNAAVIPLEQNFFSAPPFDHLLVAARPAQPGDSGLTTSTNAVAQFQVFQMPDSGLPRDANQSGRPPSVAQWAAVLRVALSNQSLAKPRPDGLPRYAQPPAGADDATVVLAATSIAEPGLGILCDASRRPRAVFPVPWDDGFNAILPHLASLKGLHRVLDARVAAKLARGDTEGAFADVECALRLAGAAREEPLVISQLVLIAQYAIAERTLWRGIAAHAWNDAQLVTLQQQLARPDFLKGMAFALEGERSLAIGTIDRWNANRRLFAQQADSVASERPGDDGMSAGSILMPSGWFRQNQAALATYYQPLVDAVRRLETNQTSAGFSDLLKQLETDSNARFVGAAQSPSPYNIFVRLLAPAISKAFYKAIRAQVSARCAATGCALERYRLKHGEYPANLSALVPDFLPAVPQDPMDRQPLRYARTSDGLFRLWSVGEDGKDDGGIMRPADDKKHGGPNLDWPWPYTMP